MDDIGLGKLLGSIFFYSFLFIAIIGFVLFYTERFKKIAFWWGSLMANIILFSYVSEISGYNDLMYYIQLFIVIAWPIINIAWMYDMMRGYFKNKKDINNEKIKKIKRIILTLVVIIIFVFLFFDNIVFGCWI